MDLDFKNVAHVLDDSSKFLKNVADEHKEDFQIIPKVQNKFQELKTVVDIDKIKRGVPDMDSDQKKIVYVAIDNFLQQVPKKEAQEKAGTVAAMIFSNPDFVNFTKKLKDLSNFLKRGERVEPTEHEGL